MIHWNVSPALFEIGGFSPRWYGLCFAFGFVVAYWILREKVFRKEAYKIEDLDSLLMHTILGTVIGARLGHCLFYEPEYYLHYPLKILFIWEGGLASHGGTAGVLISTYLFMRKHKQYTWAWLVDRMCLVIGFVAGMIRVGNVMNSEIYGKPTDLPWAFVFERVDQIPRHPTQLYEALSYFAIFVFIQIYWTRAKHIGKAAVFGWFFILVFTSRFFLEFTKEAQASFEIGWPIKMGQILSIPFVLAGLYFVLKSRKLEDTRSLSGHQKKRKNSKKS